MKEQKGITLVALVITIIVLLILAGVSISLVIGNNGVLTQASSSVVTDKAATARQALQMAQAAVETYHYAQWAGNTSVTRNDLSNGTKGSYSDSTNGLVAQLGHDGYKVGTFSGTTFTEQTDGSEVQAIISATGAEFAIQNTAGENFVFANVKVDVNTGKLTYEGSPAKVTVYNASGVKQGEVNL